MGIYAWGAMEVGVSKRRSWGGGHGDICRRGKAGGREEEKEKEKEKEVGA